MDISSAIRMMLPEHPRKNLMSDLIKVMFWVGCLMAPLFLAMSFNEALDQRTVARSVPTDALVDRLFRSKAKGHPLYVSISFDREQAIGGLCKVDVPVQADPSGLTAGATIRIVRVGSGCGVPLLVDYLPSPVDSLTFSAIGAVVSLCLFFTQWFRTDKGRLSR